MKKNDRNQLIQLSRIATALAASQPLPEMARVVGEECRKTLAADSVCVYLLQDTHYEMVYQFGCSQPFIESCGRLPFDALPIRPFFHGEPNDFAELVPVSREAAAQSRRKAVAYTTLMVNDKPVGVIGYGYDEKPQMLEDRFFLITLTNLCAQALERARLMDHERDLLREAEAANKAKTDFLANMNHEIRTPLGVISGYMDLILQSKNLNKQERLWASAVRRNASELTQIIGDVLDIAKIESEKLEFEHIAFSLSDLLEGLKTTLEPLAQNKKLKLTFQNFLNEDHIHSDPVRLRQILINLIGNAIKFTRVGGVHVELTTSHPDTLVVKVTDSGIGIAEKDRKRIFEPFQQGEISLRRKCGGTGLGLAIARRLARGLGGDLQLTNSREDSGSQFTLTLPLKTLDDTRSTNTDSVTNRLPRTKGRLAGLNILVVDDSDDTRELVGYILNEEGANVETACDGRECLVKTSDRPFSLILLDIRMPGLDGYETVDLIRQRGYTQPVAALTAHALRSERQHCLESGFDDYITKPVERSTLISRVSQLTRTRHEGGQLN